MPGWHESTKELRESGKIQMLGIVQEQHGDRARLFMQWKQMGWPVLVDALNELEVPYVPITLGIDEYGIIRYIPSRSSSPDEIETQFVSQSYNPPADSNRSISARDRQSILDARSAAAVGGRMIDRVAFANAIFKWGGHDRLYQSISAYSKLSELYPGTSAWRFRHGVALRARYDSPLGELADFQAAVDSWSGALELDPNDYICRRRIQQYGARLGKPYPFYDWVSSARSDIEARGETPSELVVEPRGAELASPGFDEDATLPPPDPDGKIEHDPGWIRVEDTVVPSAVRAGGAYRVHFSFEPSGLAHWNNEVGDLSAWMDLPEGWKVESPLGSAPRSRSIVSTERRSVEFEIHTSDDTKPGLFTLAGYALYYVCEDATGACLYRRQDLKATVRVLPNED